MAQLKAGDKVRLGDSEIILKAGNFIEGRTKIKLGSTQFTLEGKLVGDEGFGVVLKRVVAPPPPEPEPEPETVSFSLQAYLGILYTPDRKTVELQLRQSKFPASSRLIKEEQIIRPVTVLAKNLKGR